MSFLLFLRATELGTLAYDSAVDNFIMKTGPALCAPAPRAPQGDPMNSMCHVNEGSEAALRAPQRSLWLHRPLSTWRMRAGVPQNLFKWGFRMFPGPRFTGVVFPASGVSSWVRIMADVGVLAKSSGYSGGPGEVPFLRYHFRDPSEVQSCHSSDLGGVQPGHSGVSGRGPSWSVRGPMQGFSEHSVLSSGDWAPVWPHMWLLTPS